MPSIKKVKSQEQPETNESRLLAAAIRCIEKYGVKKTFIDDIAKEAGLSRPTAYRVFSSRNELLERVAKGRVDEMEAKMKPRMLKYGSFEEALIQGTIASMQVSKKDKIFNAILEVVGEGGIERYLVQPTSHAHDNISGVWNAVIERAQASGELRAGLTKDEAITWIASVECILMLRNDMTTKEQEQFLKKFMLPALIEPKRAR
jgi:AcrR family transcriptional regulator